MITNWLNDKADDSLWFTPRKKSYGAVGFIFNESDSAAQETIAKGMLKLNTQQFFEQRYLSGLNIVSDVYGLKNYRGHNWYVKFYLDKEDDDEFIGAISFHPLDERMTCESGEELDVTYEGECPWKS